MWRFWKWAWIGWIAAGAACCCPAPIRGEDMENDGEAEEIEFRVNGEAVTRKFIMEGLDEANACAPEVCPTDLDAAWGIRRARLLNLIPIRQFLEREKIVVSAEEIEKRLKEMKEHPDPFGRFPPKPLSHVMVRDCMSWDDVRLLIRADIGMKRWAERQRQRLWPTPEAWAEHCRERRPALLERFGKFRRLAFSIGNWPKGAKDETEALARLKEQADVAKRELDAGADFSALAARLFPDPDRQGDAAPATVQPIALWGERHMATLRELPVNAISPTLGALFGWEIVKKEAMTDDDVAGVIEAEFLARTRLEMEQKTAREARIEKVNWTENDRVGGATDW